MYFNVVIAVKMLTTAIINCNKGQQKLRYFLEIIKPVLYLLYLLNIFMEQFYFDKKV